MRRRSSRCERESAGAAQAQKNFNSVVADAAAAAPHPLRYDALPLHGTRTPWARMHASARATVYTVVGGGRALTDGGRAPSRCPCLQSSR